MKEAERILQIIYSWRGDDKETRRRVGRECDHVIVIIKGIYREDSNTLFLPRLRPLETSPGDVFACRQLVNVLGLFAAPIHR